MSDTLKSHLSALPTPTAGLALGVVSLGQCLNDVVGWQGIPRIVCVCISSFLFLLVAIRFIFCPSVLIRDFKHPVIGAIVPTFAMCAMLLSRYFYQWFPQLCLVTWCAAVLIHSVCLGIFLVQWFRHFSNKDMIPAWFIPPIGIMVAAVSCPNEQFVWIGKFTIVIGVLSLFVVVPILIWRLVYHPEIPQGALPTFAILAAPASLTLASYLSVTDTPIHLICYVLLVMAIVMTFVIYGVFFKLLRLPFSPGFAAYTFPLTIGVTALLKTHAFLNTISDYWLTVAIYGLAVFELIVASLIVIYVCFCYLRGFIAYIKTCHV